MNITVGTLYSIQSFLELAHKNYLSEQSFLASYVKYLVTSPEVIFKLSKQNEWISCQDNGDIRLTNKGTEIIEGKTPLERLRIQLKLMIILHEPSWLYLVHKGRKEVSSFFSPDIYQCFDEADLLSSYTPDVASWWDEVANLSRGKRDEKLLEIGRIGELLSIEYETIRTEIQPTWQSIDSNLSGYDLLSCVDKDNSTVLRIEVKASNSNLSFYLTRNEWETALSSNFYLFHFWKIEKCVKFYILDKEFIKPHISIDVGYGKWEKVKVTFNEETIHPFEQAHRIPLDKIRGILDRR
ncbi:DUF3883 domain-containing protein [Priestia megaterium]|uniref:DUF3883 domain-containing protein n=1 Tax=Priestia megaterium TaxID=1404 RepID=UPI00316F62E6